MIDKYAQEKIFKLIKELAPYEAFDESTRLIDTGILNSLSLMALIAQLEDEFNIEISDGNITAENFATISQIIVTINL